jgi:hypothetical protein
MTSTQNELCLYVEIIISVNQSYWNRIQICIFAVHLLFIMITFQQQRKEKVLCYMRSEDREG